jgi:glycosyltransferase involved in cell wall biosynthesis
VKAALMSLKVLVISNYNDPIVTRPEAEIFIGLKKQGLEIDIITPGDSEYARKFRDAGIRVHDKLISKKYNKDEVGFIRQILKEGGHHILQLFNGAAIVNGIQAAKGIDVKVVLYRGFSGHIHWWDPTAYTKFLHPRADKIICNSVGVEEILKRQKFFNAEKAVTINKGHNLEWYADIKPFSREELAIDKESLAIACVANNRPMKGVRYLMEAVTKLPAAMPFDLFLIGKGLDSEEFKSIIFGSPNENKVHFMGFRKDALRIVSACDVFALASVKGESITKAALEAMSLAVAPVISDIAGNRELVINGENGFVFESRNSDALAECLLKLEADRNLTKRMGEKSKDRIATVLSSDTTIRKYRKLYEELSGLS